MKKKHQCLCQLQATLLLHCTVSRVLTCFVSDSGAGLFAVAAPKTNIKRAPATTFSEQYRDEYSLLPSEHDSLLRISIVISADRFLHRRNG